MSINRKHLPQFFILGAQKAGTTTLQAWLSMQPSICMPKRKETHFFSHDERFALGLDWYINQFPNRHGGQLYGEVDPEYLFFPEAMLRMKNLALSPRFIVIVREPLRRAFSHYRMSVRRGLENLPFNEALHQEEVRLSTGKNLHIRHHSYMKRGHYTDQISRCRYAFPDSELLVLVFERLFNPEHSRGEFYRLCSFLGIEDILYPEVTTMKYNPATLPRANFLNELLWRKQKWQGLRQCARVLIPSSSLKYTISRILDRFNQRKASSPNNWMATVDDRFFKQAQVETERLSQTFGLDLSDWSTN